MTLGTSCVFVAIAVQIFPASALAQETAPPRTARYILEIERQIAGKEKRPAEEVFKNIRVFTGQPALRVLRIMEQAFAPNLGVECSHCHVPGEWESDAKAQKQIAREMWLLRGEVQNRLRKIVGREDLPFTCYSCHKGQAKPAFAPGG
jgi:hypothetical protein